MKVIVTPARVEIPDLPGTAFIHVDDNATGSFAGMTPSCDGCGNRVAYLNGDVPSTEEEAALAAFIPCVEDESANLLYCLPCVASGDVISADPEEEE